MRGYTIPYTYSGYILKIDGQIQRIYISKRTDSTPLCLPNICPPNLSLLCLQYSILQLPDCLTEQAGGEVRWANVWKTQWGAVRSLTNTVYILWLSLFFFWHAHQSHLLAISVN